MSRWFRMYDEILDDPKVQKLTPELFRFWVNALALASRNNGIITLDEDVSFAFRLCFKSVSKAFQELAEKGLFDVSKNGYRPHNWDKRQFKSDTSTERVKRFRAVSGNVSVTPPETETDTYSEKKEKNKLKLIPKEKRGTSISIDFEPDASCWELAESLNLTNAHCQNELNKFLDYWRAVPGAKGRKTDWQATFRNWLRNSKGKPNGYAPRNPPIADTFAEIDRRIADYEKQLERDQNSQGAGDENLKLIS